MGRRRPNNEELEIARRQTACELLIRPLQDRRIWPEVWEVGPAMYKRDEHGQTQIQVDVLRLDKHPRFRQKVRTVADSV